MIISFNIAILINVILCKVEKNTYMILNFKAIS